MANGVNMGVARLPAGWRRYCCQGTRAGTECNKARALFKAFILGKRITGDWSCEDQQDHVMALVYGKMKKQ